jgi:hypothetical protein
MRHHDHRILLPPVECCRCERPLTGNELDEFYTMTDESLHGDVHCPSCAAGHLELCRECSCRRTADPSGLCSLCAAQEYGMAV